MSEIRNLTRNGETFYPLTHVDGVLGRNGVPLGEVNDIFDVSEYNASGDPLVYPQYDTLSLALAAVPQERRKGGMTIRYIDSVSGKYVQYRYMSSSTSNTDFINTTDWQGIDSEPIADSKNLIESGGVKEYVDSEINYSVKYKTTGVKEADDDSDLSISDDEGNVIVTFHGGQVKTKGFNSTGVNDFVEFSDINFASNKNTLENSDLDISDEQGNVIVSLKDGDIVTKNFNSTDSTTGKYDSSEDVFSLSDTDGNVVLSVTNEGHIKTKSFDSSLSPLSSNTDNLEPLAIGNLIQGKVGNHKIDSSTTSLVSSSLAVPYLETEFVILIDSAYIVTVYGGYVDGDAGTYFPKNVGTFVNGEKFTLPLYANTANTKVLEYMRLQVSRVGGGTITPLDNVNLSLLYDKKYSIVDSNSDIIDELQAKGTKKVNNKSSRGFYLTIVHGSDIHGDFERLKNLYLVADNIEADAIVLTGDLVAHNHYDYIKPLITLAKSYKVPTLICSGNHEVGFNYAGHNFEIDDAGVYDYVFSELSEYFEYQATDSVVSTVPYYYIDIPSKNVRFISVYQYINGTQDAGEELTLRWDLHYNQTEMDWFCNILASTPENYGIVLLIHTPELSQNGGKIQDNDLFFTNYNFGNIRSSVQNGQPILEIIDAFISRGTLQKTYTQKGTPSSFTVDADFSNVPESIEFIAQVSGHYHRDAIGLVNGAQERQVSLNISCTAGVSYQSNSCDTPRNINNKTGDSFNVYVVNMETKAIDVYKMGAHYTTDNRNRTHMSVQYK